MPGLLQRLHKRVVLRESGISLGGSRNLPIRFHHRGQQGNDGERRPLGHFVGVRDN